MVTKMMEKLLTMGRREHHTIISREIIRPSSPTPSHLQTYNLSSLDQLTHHKYIPLILLYPNNGNCSLTADDKVWELKKSLSRSLTQFYPFAGRLRTPTTPYIDCNDAGVVFLEAKNDSQLDKFQYMSEHDETLVQLFADNMVYFNSPHGTSLVGVQVNHFACGGMGVAFSMSHIVGDGSTLCSFVNHWASVARYGSTDHKEVLPLNPHILHFPRTHTIHPEAKVTKQDYVERATKKFVFPNSKLRDLTNNVKASMAAGSKLSIDQVPTQVEVLTSLLFRAAVEAATTKSGCFKPSCLVIPVDLRKKFVPKLPQTTMGNFVSAIMVPCKDTSETSLSVVVSGIKKHKAHLKRLQSVQQAAEHYRMLLSKGSENYSKNSYWCSCLCRIPYRKADFGWGDPTRATIGLRWIDRDTFILMDAPDGNGIDAYVALEKEEMEIFQNNKELLSFCRN